MSAIAWLLTAAVLATPVLARAPVDGAWGGASTGEGNNCRGRISGEATSGQLGRVTIELSQSASPGCGSARHVPLRRR